MVASGVPSTWEELLIAKLHMKEYVNEAACQRLLTFEDSPFELTSVEKITLILVGHAAAVPSKMLIVHPPSDSKLIAPMALEALRANPSRVERPRLLVVTPNIATRDQFMRFKAGYQIYHERFFPVGMIRGDGSIRDLSEVWIGRHSIPPYALFTYSAAVLPTAQIARQVFMLIVEIDERSPLERYLDLMGWASSHCIRSVVFVSTNPFSEQTIGVARSGVPCWGWTTELLGACLGAGRHQKASPRPFSISDSEFLNAVAGIRKVIVPVKEDKLEILFSEARTRQQEMMKLARSREDLGMADLCMRLLSAIHALEEVVVPIDYYEKEAARTWGTVTIESRLRALERRSSELERHDPSTSSFFNQTIGVLRKIVDLTKLDRCGKPTALLRVVDAVKEKHSSAIIVVRNRAAVRSLENFLRDEGRGMGFLLENRIGITTASDFHIAPCSQISIMTGLTKAQQNLLRSLRVRTQAFLLYPQQIPYAEHLIRESKSTVDELVGLDKQAEFIGQLGKCKTHEIEATKSRIEESLKAPESDVEFAVAQEASVRGTEVQPLAKNILEDEETAWEREYSAEDVQSEIDDGQTLSETEYVEAVPVVLEDGKVILVRPSRHVTIYDEYSNNLERLRASSLRVGQTLVVINSSVRKTLAEVLIERIEHHPKMFETVVLRRMWIEALLKGMEQKGDTPTTLLRKIQQRGSKIGTSVAIHFWRSGEIIGPQDKEDIRLIGEVYDDKVLLTNLDRVWKAVQRLRTIHRQLAYNLRYLLPEYGMAWKSAKDNMDFVVDRDLNLYLEDFKDAISLERIVSIEPAILSPIRCLNSKIDRSAAEGVVVGTSHIPEEPQ